MPSYERQTRVRAPLDDVWEFHSRVSGLEALTPDWLGLRVENVRGPDGEPDPDVLEPGSEVSLSIRPFAMGPRQRWTSRIQDRERTDGTAYFRDEMIRGPFDRWVHTHVFYADGDETIVRDRVEYALAQGPLRTTEVAEPLDRLTAPFSAVGFEMMFRERHQRTRELLE